MGNIMPTKLLSLIAAAALLAACSSDPETTGDTTGAGATASTGTTGAGTQGVTSQAVAGPAAGSQEDLLVNVGDRVFFGYDRSDLSAAAQGTVETLAAWLNTYPQVTVTVEGHADERGTRDYNPGGFNCKTAVKIIHVRCFGRDCPLYFSLSFSPYFY